MIVLAIIVIVIKLNAKDKFKLSKRFVVNLGKILSSGRIPLVAMLFHKKKKKKTY